jgi:hypothetical protein
MQEVLSGDKPESSALTLNQPFTIRTVRLKTAARQNSPFSKFSAGKVESPVHLA